MKSISLRMWQREDAQPLALIANNRNIWNNLRNHMPNPYTVMDAMQWIQKCGEEKPPRNFAVIYNSMLAGSIGFVPKDDVYKKSMEIGYFIGENFWGNGIASEAVKQLLEYIQPRFDVVRFYAEVFEHNKNSMRVLMKNGFYLESIQRKAVFKNNKLSDAYVWVKLV